MSESSSTHQKKCKIVISDFHIGSGLYLKDGTRNILEDFQYDDALISFLKYHSTGEYHDAEVELIINGDFFNLLQINYKGVYTHLITERIVVEGLRQSIEGHRPIFTAMREFAATPKHTISYVIGNHDQGMLFEKARAYFSDVLKHEVKYYDSFYEFDGIRVEHGHMYEWNSRFDSARYFVTRDLPEPVLNLPWGSVFVAEFLPKVKMERPYVDKVKPFRAMLRWMFMNDTLFALKTAVKVLYYFVHSMLFSSTRKYFTWKGTLTLLKSLTVYPRFEREARKIMALNPSTHALIMGHTHVLLYRRFPEGKEYFNIGTWNEATNLQVGNLGTLVALTYAHISYPVSPEGVNVEASFDKTLTRPTIKLKEWKGFWRPDVDAAL